MNAKFRLLFKLFAIAMLFTVSLPEPNAEELIGRFTLGYGDISQETGDPKKPSPGLLSAKFGLKESRGFKPYLGTGLIYTLQQNEKSGNRTISTGIAGQAGFSYFIDKNSLLNIDYKYLHMPPDSSKPESTPQSIGIGVEIRF